MGQYAKMEKSLDKSDKMKAIICFLPPPPPPSNAQSPHVNCNVNSNVRMGKTELAFQIIH